MRPLRRAGYILLAALCWLALIGVGVDVFSGDWNGGRTLRGQPTSSLTMLVVFAVAAPVLSMLAWRGK